MIIDITELDNVIAAIHRIEAKLDNLQPATQPAPLPTPIPSEGVVANPANYLSVLQGAVSGDIISLEDGIYLNGLDVPDNVTVNAVNGLGSVYFTKGTVGNSYSNGIIRLSGTGSTIDGLITHDPDDITAHSIFVPGDSNKVLNCIGYNGGKHKHKLPCFVSGSNNLIEDSAFFGEGRYTFQVFKARSNTIRRCIARWDSTVQGYLTEPNAAFSNYNASGTLWENCVSLDYNSTPEPMKYGGDFYSPHNNYQWPEGNRDNGWYGCIVVYHNKGNDTRDNNNKAFMADSNASAGNCVNNTIQDFYAKGALRDFIIKPGSEYNI